MPDGLHHLYLTHTPTGHLSTLLHTCHISRGYTHGHSHTHCSMQPYIYAETQRKPMYTLILPRFLSSALPEAQLFDISLLTAVQIYLATLQATVCVCVCQSMFQCVYLAESSASFCEQMVLQQVITTQDKLLN